MVDSRISEAIGDAYARYDADPRAGDLDDFGAFADAVKWLIKDRDPDLRLGWVMGYEAGYECGYRDGFWDGEAEV